METTQTQKAEDYLKLSKTLQTRDGFMLLEKLDPKEGNVSEMFVYNIFNHHVE